MQMFNLFACKTRFTIPFGKYMFANRAPASKSSSKPRAPFPRSIG
jgi:hypothetical protein